MRSRASRNGDAAMDLFPFMAVLICTVGALIMLLVVMVQQARAKAQEPSPAVIQPAQEQQQRQVAELAKQREVRLAEYEQRKAAAAEKKYAYDEYKWKAELLRSSHEQAIEQITDQRLVLAHLESHSRELANQAGAMQAEADLIAETARKTVQQDAQNAAQLEALQQAISSAESTLEKVKEEYEQVDPKYVLIPYEGPNGTHRRPIYIECLPDRVVLQPENVLLIGEDFLAPMTAENPLAAALRAKREFLQENGLIGPDAEPYPLLVVRPGAASSYAAARSAMQTWESEFGYELVEADVDLDYTQADPRLKQLLEDVVLDARGRRRMMRSMRANVRPRQRERLRPSASGGFESVGGGDESFQGPGNDAGKAPFETAGVAGAPGTRRDESGQLNEGSFGAGPSNLQGNLPGHASHRESGQFDRSGRGSSGRSAEASRWDGPAGSGNGQGDGRADQSGRLPNASEPSSDFAQQETNPEGSPLAPGSGGDSRRPGLGGSSAEASGGGGKGASGGGGSSSVASMDTSQAAGGMQMAGSPGSLATSRGSGWAVANLQSDAVGIERPIYVVCRSDSFVLLPEKGTKQTLQTFRHRGHADRVVDNLVQAVRKRMDSWGIAGQGIYWKPVLKIRVHEQAETAYGQLRHLLDDSGIEVTREP